MEHPLDFEWVFFFAGMSHNQPIYDVVLAVQEEYLAPKVLDDYHRNVLLEGRLILNALERKGLKVARLAWSDPAFDWSCTRAVLIREAWDYVQKLSDFQSWVDRLSGITNLINTVPTIRWNMDKFYLRDLSAAGINIPATMFIEKGDVISLDQIVAESGWGELVVKPAIAGAARDTRRIKHQELERHEEWFLDMTSQEAMLVQDFQKDIIETGEKTLVMIDGEWTHAVLKVAKPGDFRVQDDFGGSVHKYQPTGDEMDFARRVMSQVKPVPLYGRVDLITDNQGHLALQELELIEPELWFRFNMHSAERLAESILRFLDHGGKEI